ncbi:helix-turn-helix domain-containing protein [Brevibacillus sp. SYSU BS000544]|uniref:helix-turn-helix domain-containing protein n=1 Tax=Brevibacillus sp. SYSU BS000544 TaxID=3416443 RepID=UPI003CE453FD
MDNQSTQKNYLFLGVSIIIGAWFIYNGLGRVSFSADLDTSSITNGLNSIAYRMQEEQPAANIAQKKKLLTESDVVEYLGISRADLTMLIQQTDIPYIQVNQIKFFPVNALDQWLLESGRKYKVQPK